ncbi:MAG: hypothetical protein IJV62_05245 [Eggerthellaceae bacterium]|nr:hypothetical protein [Eggerthellaceae bacterium]
MTINSMSGELSCWDASRKLGEYSQKFHAMSTSAEKNYNDMDFENADKRKLVAAEIEKIKAKCAAVDSAIQDISFEQ